MRRHPSTTALTLAWLLAASIGGIAVLAEDVKAVLPEGRSTALLPGEFDELTPDRFEPDDNRDETVRIGLPRPPRPGEDRPGQLMFELQSHNIYPVGDQDWTRLRLAVDSLVRIRTSCGFPTIFNGEEACTNPPELDTIVTLWYATAWSTTGLCNNTGDEAFPPGNVTTRAFNACDTDLDCDFNENGIVYPEDLDDLINPVPGLPACLPWELFPPGTRPLDPDDNPLVVQDDADPIAGDRGSDVTICLPRTGRSSTSASVQADPAKRFNWYVRTAGWSDSGVPEDSDLTFDYDIYVQNLEPCRFEFEPNNAFDDVYDFGDDDDDDDDDDSRLHAGGPSVHGIYDLSATSPAPDVDLFALDVPEAGVYVIETDGYDPIAVDTFIELWVGPDENGDFLFTGYENDDISLGDRRSRLEVTLVPACEALGMDCAALDEDQPQPSYFISVSSAFVVPNFPYELRAYRADTEPDETVCKSGVALDGRFAGGGLGGGCTP